MGSHGHGGLGGDHMGFGIGIGTGGQPGHGSGQVIGGVMHNYGGTFTGGNTRAQQAVRPPPPPPVQQPVPVPVANPFRQQQTPVPIPQAKPQQTQAPLIANPPTPRAKPNVGPSSPTGNLVSQGVDPALALGVTGAPIGTNAPVAAPSAPTSGPFSGGLTSLGNADMPSSDGLFGGTSGPFGSSLAGQGVMGSPMSSDPTAGALGHADHGFGTPGMGTVGPGPSGGFGLGTMGGAVTGGRPGPAAVGPAPGTALGAQKGDFGGPSIMAFGSSSGDIFGARPGSTHAMGNQGRTAGPVGTSDRASGMGSQPGFAPSPDPGPRGQPAPAVGSRSQGSISPAGFSFAGRTSHPDAELGLPTGPIGGISTADPNADLARALLAHDLGLRTAERMAEQGTGPFPPGISIGDLAARFSDPVQADIDAATVEGQGIHTLGDGTTLAARYGDDPVAFIDTINKEAASEGVAGRAAAARAGAINRMMAELMGDTRLAKQDDKATFEANIPGMADQASTRPGERDFGQTVLGVMAALQRDVPGLPPGVQDTTHYQNPATMIARQGRIADFASPEFRTDPNLTFGRHLFTNTVGSPTREQMADIARRSFDRLSTDRPPMFANPPTPMPNPRRGQQAGFVGHDPGYVWGR